MASGTHSKTTYIGTLGELLAQIELLKQGIFAQPMGPLFDYDLMTTKHQRIEVKTASPSPTSKTVKGKKYASVKWQFRNYDKGNIPVKEQKGRKRECDFYIFVCLNQDQTYKTSYIIPESRISTKLMINLGDSEKNQFKEYREQWKLLK